MKRLTVGLMAAAAVWAGGAMAQDLPGMSLGGFYETRIDNKVAEENLSFDYYGVRFQFRDERWFTVFVDLGSQSAEWGDLDANASGFYGLGGTLWLQRAEDLMIPVDLGLAGSFHTGDLDLDLPSGATRSATYTTWTAQGVARLSGYGIARPFIRAGMMGSKLDVEGFGEDGDWDVVNPAVNAGLEIAPSDQLVITVEGNYSEGVGFGVHADLWF